MKEKLNKLTKIMLCTIILLTGLFVNPLEIKAEDADTYAAARRVYFDETFAHDD